MATVWTALDRMRGGQGTAQDMKTLVDALDELAAYRAGLTPRDLALVAALAKAVKP